MRKINKEINIAVIFTFIGMFLCQNIYAFNMSLRVPVGQIPTNRTQEVILIRVFNKLSTERDAETFIAALEEMDRGGMFDSYEFTKRFIAFYRKLNTGLQNVLGETLGKKIIEDQKSITNVNVGDCWILEEYYIRNPVPYQVLNLIILASDPRATGGFIPSELNKEGTNTLHKIYNSLSGGERFRLCAYLDGVASGITPWLGPLREIGALGGYPLILSMRLKAAAQNVAIPEGKNTISYPDFSTDSVRNPSLPRVSHVEPEEITAKVVQILKERLGDSPSFAKFSETIQKNNVRFIRGKPPYIQADLPVEESILGGPVVMGIAYATDSEGFPTGIESVTAYVVEDLNPGHYSKLVHELTELEVINWIIKAKSIKYDKFQELVNFWYSDFKTWLLMCERADIYRFNDDETFESAFNVIMHVFGMLMIKANHPKIDGIYALFGDSQLAKEFRASLKIFRELAMKKEVQVKYGELLQKFVEEYKGDVNRFSIEDKKVVLLWLAEFFERANIENARQSFLQLATGL